MSTEDPLRGEGRERSSAVVRSEQLSTQALTIELVGRRDELAAARHHLLAESGVPDGRTLLIRGDSGTGKTFFARHLIRRLHESRPSSLCLYLDVANDEYESARLLTSLLRMVLVPGAMKGGSSIHVPDGLTLQRHRRKAKERGVGRGIVRAAAQSIGSAFGAGQSVGAVLDGLEEDRASHVEDELVGYLRWAAKRDPVFLAIDNIQFLNVEDRLTFESVVQRAGRKLRFIAIDRTIRGASELDPPIRCFADAQLIVEMTRLTSDQTSQLVAAAVGDEVASLRLARDIFAKTGGLAKDVEYCLRQYSLELGRGAPAGAIEGLLATVNQLPLIHRQFLVIAALLDGGVRTAIARGTVARLAVAYNNAELDEVVSELIACDYLRLNGESGDRLRPGHERMVTAVRELADDELREEVRRSLVAELTHALQAPDTDAAETYLLHCLVGLQTAQELARNVDYISRLIQSQHRQDQFSYLVAIADELYEVLPLLPQHVLNDLLDAMQKSSAFEKGLQVLAMLDAQGAPGSADRQMYRLKYLTQAYRYDDALELADSLEPSDWLAVYQVNTLMALDRDEDALALTEAMLRAPHAEAQAVLRRNTVSLFPAQTALRMLDESYEYFERQQSDFRLATVDTNRSLVYLHTRSWREADRCLVRAVDRMSFVGSREIYQAQLNKAILSALQGDHDTALETLEEAALHVPRALLFDRVKIRINRAVVERLAGLTDADACEQALADCYESVRGLQMPYLHKVIEGNQAAARGELRPVPWPDTGRVGLTAPLAARGGRWGLPMSVHWRY